MSIHHELSDALEANDATIVERLLKEHPDLVNSPDWTPPPLHCAILWDKPQMAELLLDHGADIEMRDPDRNTTPLRYAIMYAKKDAIHLLLARGADPGTVNGSTAMELATEAAAGSYEQYDDLPSRETYGEVVELLEGFGVA